ncbi:hypothetical protein KDH_02800 [Dictyobacter sp. S3.2.2.5]|uniref:HAMP domain-containing protein n=1 Tax=Dictyobacter halimunensis TaxID=3026934 RepID=A0ABQ6FKT5_9CHLR|nr:hypothetical protein KDH_02800 [Dictyobacter sp. S3.2.2.5]
MNDSLSFPENTSWWLRLTAPPGTQSYDIIPDRKARDRLRKAGLISGVAPFVFFAPLLLAGQAADPSTLTAIGVCMAASVVALVFNRLGQQTVAALLLILAMDAVIESALLRAPGGLGDAWLLTFDLFLLPLFLPGMLLSRNAIWFFLVLHVAFILGDFYLLPHSADLDTLVAHWGQSVAFARPLILEIGIGLLCFFQVRSTDQAIARADRAEEIAALQRIIADQKEQLEADIYKLSEVLSQAANGRFNVRADVERGNILWRVASQTNMLLTRLQTSRQSDAVLKQTEIEVARLIDAIRASKRGEQVIWPLPSGGLADGLIAELRNMPASSGTGSTPPNRPRPSQSLNPSLYPRRENNTR